MKGNRDVSLYTQEKGKPKHFKLSLNFFYGMWKKDGRKEMFYLTTHSTYFIYGYMASDIW